MNDDFEKYKAELDNKIESADTVLLEKYRRRINNIKTTVDISEAFQYLPRERALCRLRKEHQYLEHQYKRCLQADSFAKSSNADQGVLDTFATLLQLYELALKIVAGCIQYAESDAAVELFSEMEDNGNTLLMNAKTLYVCWSVDPTFKGIRYLERITNLSRKNIVRSLRAFKETPDK